MWKPSLEGKYGRWFLISKSRAGIRILATPPPHSPTVLLFLVIKPEASEGFIKFLCSLSWSYSECFINIQNVRAIWLKHSHQGWLGDHNHFHSSISPPGSFWESCTWWKRKTFPRTGGYSLVIKVTWVVLGIALGCVHAQLLTCVCFFATPWTAAPRLLCPWDFPGKNTGVGRHFFLQGILLTHGSNSGLLHCRQTLYHWVTREALPVYYGD